MHAYAALADCDCLIVGAGPAGLTAAIYLARFHLSVIVVDSGQSRARMIALTRNLAGFPDGISGQDLLADMGRQAQRYGAGVRRGTVTSILRSNEGFTARTEDGEIRARALLLATGVVNRRPAMIDDQSHDRALAEGLLRYCPICDGYEVTDRRIAVLGTGERGCAEALFLRSYSRSVTLVAPAGGHELDAEHLSQLGAGNIRLAGQCRAIKPRADGIELDIDGDVEVFDTLYPALGSDIRSDLARALGATCSDQGCLIVDSHQRTDIPGLYAAGDVVLGLDQISHAIGEGGVAATTIRNDRARQTPLRR